MSKRKVPAIVTVLILALAVSACSPRDKARPPKEDPADPYLVTVGSAGITVGYLKFALGNIPLVMRTRYMTEEGKKNFIERQIDTMAYYHEGIRRGLDKKPEYQDKLDKLQKLTLIHMDKDALFDKHPPPTPAEIEKGYERYRQKEESAKRTPKPLAEVEKGLKNTVDAEHYQKAYRDRVAALRQEYGLKINGEALKKPLPEIDLKTLVVESRAFNLDMEDFISWARTLPEHLQKLASTEDGRKYLADLHVENEMLFYDALLQKLDKTEEFARRMFVAKVGLLGQITQESITSRNLQATKEETREYFDKHPAEFKGKSWEESRVLAGKKTSMEKKARVTKELAFALRRDRYPVKYMEERIKNLDLSGETKGEWGLIFFPLVPQGTEIVDLDSIPLGGKTPEAAPPENLMLTVESTPEVVPVSPAPAAKEESPLKK